MQQTRAKKNINDNNNNNNNNNWYFTNQASLSLTLREQIQLFLEIIKLDNNGIVVTQEVVPFKNDIFIIVDMQNDFLGYEDGYPYKYNAETKAASLPTQGAVEMCHCIGSYALAILNDDINHKKERGCVILTRDFHHKYHASFPIFGEHCVGGSEDSSGSYIYDCLLGLVSHRDDLLNRRLFYAFKAFHRAIDSFGAFSYYPYYNNGDQEDKKRVRERILHKEYDRSNEIEDEEIDLDDEKLLERYSGSFVYLDEGSVDYKKLNKARQICSREGETSQNCLAPRLETILSQAATMQQKLMQKEYNKHNIFQITQNKTTNVFICGVLGDFCVLDTAITARTSGLFQNIYIIFDLIRSLRTKEDKKLVYKAQDWFNICSKHKIRIILSANIYFTQNDHIFKSENEMP